MENTQTGRRGEKTVLYEKERREEKKGELNRRENKAKKEMKRRNGLTCSVTPIRVQHNIRSGRKR
jgi:hypothetical protein